MESRRDHLKFWNTTERAFAYNLLKHKQSRHPQLGMYNQPDQGFRSRVYDLLLEILNGHRNKVLLQIHQAVGY